MSFISEDPSLRVKIRPPVTRNGKTRYEWLVYRHGQLEPILEGVTDGSEAQARIEANEAKRLLVNGKKKSK